MENFNFSPSTALRPLQPQEGSGITENFNFCSSTALRPLQLQEGSEIISDFCVSPSRTVRPQQLQEGSEMMENFNFCPSTALRPLQPQEGSEMMENFNFCPSTAVRPLQPQHLQNLKELAARLKLQTRRPSYLEWQARLRGQRWGQSRGTGDTAGTGQSAGHGEEQREGGESGFVTAEAALEWLRSELRDMQALDQRLAQQLLRLRWRLQRLRVEQECQRHREMLDEAAFGLEGCEEDSDLLRSVPPLLCSPLRSIGLTRMNIHARRFSLC